MAHWHLPGSHGIIRIDREAGSNRKFKIVNRKLINLSSDAARELMVAAQGLHCRPSRAATRSAVLGMIRRMGALQIDTIHIVARSPYLVLWSRLGHYDPKWLDQLLVDGAIFEYWAHEACFLPIEDYGLYHHRMRGVASMEWRYKPEWFARYGDQVDPLMAHITERGPVRSIDFTREDGTGGSWWSWKPEKRVLEMLFARGDVMVRQRHNFQRIYDLRERVLPSWNDGESLPMEESYRRLALKAVMALGVTSERWVADYFRTRKQETRQAVAALVQSGELLQVEVEGWETPGLIHPDNERLARKAAAGKLGAELTTLLSPFDPLVWDRTRARAVFNFDYTLECYTPAPKRRYGYFTLPILHRGKLIGRLDPKAHRKEGQFEVKALYLEPGVEVNDCMITDVAGALRECAMWHGTPEIVIRKASVRGLASVLQKAANQAAGGQESTNGRRSKA